MKMKKKKLIQNKINMMKKSLTILKENLEI